MPVSTSSKNSDVAQFGSAELYFPYFRCLNDSDPGLGRPVSRAAPTVGSKTEAAEVGTKSLNMPSTAAPASPTARRPARRR